MKLRQGNIFTPVCHSVHRAGSASVHTHTPWAGTHTLVGTPPWAGTSPGQVHPLGRYTPLVGTPPAGQPLGQVHPPPASTPHWVGTTPQAGTPSCPWAGPPPKAGTPPVGTPPPPNGHCSGRYAYYWNAFLCNGKISVKRERWLYLLVNSLHSKLLICSKGQFGDTIAFA